MSDVSEPSRAPSPVLNGTAAPVTHYYVLNLQGDVVGLIDEDSTLVAKYTYSAWGEILSVTNAAGAAITSETNIANINPLRYRGYYYDTETGFYYLQSRYYDPVTHRFINADSYASTGQGIIGTNMFAYCGNSPIIFADLHGYGYELTIGWAGTMWWFSLVDAYLPIGDIIYAGGCVVCVIVDTVNTVGIDNIVRIATDGVESVRRAVEDFTSGTSSSPPEGPRYKSPTAKNFRYNLQQLTGQSGSGMQAHHVLPKNFINEFRAAGINIHEAKYGTWVNPQAHAKWSYAYNQSWQTFFDKNSNPSYSQIIAYARTLAREYGFSLNF